MCVRLRYEDAGQAQTLASAQLYLNQRQLRPALAHVRDSIKFFVAKTFYQVNAQPEIHQKVRLYHFAKLRY